MTSAEFGSTIAKLRNEKNMTQAELAEKLNVSTQAVSKWETGGGFPDVQTIPEIARILDTTTDYLFGCVRKQQKILWYRLGEYINGRRKYDVELNEEYLRQGWKVVQSHLSIAENDAHIMAVIEREV